MVSIIRFYLLIVIIITTVGYYNHIELSHQFIDINDISFLQLERETFITAIYGERPAAESLAKLPDWLQEYVKWHGEERMKAKNDPDYPIKYLVITCLKGEKCGGFADRMRPLPFLLLLAANTKRVFLIKWTKPHDLSEFLVPPKAGLDWRATPEFDNVLQDPFHTRGNVYYGCSQLRPELRGKLAYRSCVDVIHTSEDIQYFRLRITNDHGFLNSLNNFFMTQSYNHTGIDFPRHHAKFSDVFGLIFRVMFEPVEPIANSTSQTMAKLGLKPYQYISAHVRARYPTSGLKSVSDNAKIDKDGGFLFSTNERLREYAVELSAKTVQCISDTTSTDYPIFFASDSNDTSAYMVEHSTEILKSAQEIVSIVRDVEPLHLDVDNMEVSEPSDFYSTFEDILILGGSKCIAYGDGSYGLLGIALIGNECYAHYESTCERQLV